MFCVANAVYVYECTHHGKGPAFVQEVSQASFCMGMDVSQPSTAAATAAEILTIQVDTIEVSEAWRCLNRAYTCLSSKQQRRVRPKSVYVLPCNLPAEDCTYFSKVEFLGQSAKLMTMV